jgi:hypothetical protein
VYLGQHGHQYAFRVRATDRHGNTSPWAPSSNGSASPSLRPGGFGRVVADELTLRARPGSAAERLGRLADGTLLAITGGPVRSGGYRWVRVTGPVRAWPIITDARRGGWVAVRSRTRAFVRATRSPNRVAIVAGIRDLDFGSRASAVGSGARDIAARTFSPNGDGSRDALRLRWTNGRSLDSLTLRVLRRDGRLVGQRAITARGAGAQTWSWDGRIDGRVVPDGRYMLQLVGIARGTRFEAPSDRPATATQLARYGVVVR